MVNEERLRHLIKMARFDANDGKKCKPMAQYARKDYISLQMLKSFVTGSITYVLLFAIWSLSSVETVVQKITGNQLRGFAIMTIVLYLAFMLIYLLATYIVFHMKYTEGRRKVKKYYNSLKKVNQMYERENRLRAPANKDWE